MEKISYGEEMMLVLEHGHYVYSCDTCLRSVNGNPHAPPRGWDERTIYVAGGDNIVLHFCGAYCRDNLCLNDAMLLHRQTSNKVLP